MSLREIREQIAVYERMSSFGEQELSRLREELAAEVQRIEKEWAENSYAQVRRTRHTAEYFRGCGYLILDCKAIFQQQLR